MLTVAFIWKGPGLPFHAFSPYMAMWKVWRMSCSVKDAHTHPAITCTKVSVNENLLPFFRAAFGRFHFPFFDCVEMRWGSHMVWPYSTKLRCHEQIVRKWCTAHKTSSVYTCFSCKMHWMQPIPVTVRNEFSRLCYVDYSPTVSRLPDSLECRRRRRRPNAREKKIPTISCDDTNDNIQIICLWRDML